MSDLRSGHLSLPIFKGIKVYRGKGVKISNQATNQIASTK